MSKQKDKQVTAKEVNSSKIEAIKNLIFGENIAEYNSGFEAIKNDILEKKTALEDLIATTQTELNEAIDNLGTDLNIRITNLEDNLATKFDNLNEKKVDRKQLGDLLIKLGSKISE